MEESPYRLCSPPPSPPHSRHPAPHFVSPHLSKTVQKWFQLYFLLVCVYFFLPTVKGLLRGGKVTNYLLEKSRVTGQASGERCFHVMHYLLAGATPQETSDYHLLEPRYAWHASAFHALRLHQITVCCVIG